MLPTPEELALELLQIDPLDNAARLIHNTMIAAIRGDRKVIAYEVESLRHEPELRELPGNEAGYDAALDDVLAMLRPPK